VCRFIRRFRRLAFSRSCEYALIRWMLLCLGLGSFLLLFNEVDSQQDQYVEVLKVWCFILDKYHSFKVINFSLASVD